MSPEETLAYSELGTTEKEVQEEMEILRTSESEEQIINPVKPWPRCSRCKRFLKGHDKRRGDNCQMIIISEEELIGDD